MSSGFGRQLAELLLKRGDLVIGTIRDTKKIADLIEMTDPAVIRGVVDRSVAQRGRIGVLIAASTDFPPGA